MKRSSLLLAALLGLVLVTGLAVAASSRHAHDGPVYTVAALTALLADRPAAWINRTVRVRARPEACLLGMDGPGTPCSELHPVLVDAPPGQGAAALPLVPGHAAPLLALLRRLPQLGGLVPAPQAVRWGAVATYRVRLLGAPATACSAAPCYEALLLDAAPTSP